MTQTSAELKRILDNLEKEREKLVGEGKLAFEIGVLYGQLMGKYKRTVEWEELKE